MRRIAVLAALVALLLTNALAPFAAAQDTRHLDAVRPSGAEKAAYVAIRFSQPWSPTAALESALGLPSGGVLLAVWVQAWLWEDQNGDGYIGAPTSAQIAAYNSGTLYSPNNIFSSEIQGRASAFNTGYGHRVKPTISGPGWVPGTVVIRDFNTASPYLEFTAFPGSMHPIDLRTNQNCVSTGVQCATRDVLWLPTTPQAGWLSAAMGKLPLPINPSTGQGGWTAGVALSWTEGPSTFTANFAPTKLY